MPFVISRISDNEDGWGPSNDTVPEKYKDVPYYAPFTKGEKLGKSSDWQQQPQQLYQGKGRNQKDRETPVSSFFNYRYQDDDSSFQLVDSTKPQPQKKYLGRRNFQVRNYQQIRQQHQRGQSLQQTQQQQTRRPQQQQQQQHQQQQQQQQQQQRRQNLNRNWGNQGFNIPSKKRDLSIEVKPDWKEVEVIPFSTLTKLTIDAEPPVEDIGYYGTLEFYNRAFDRITSKNERSLERTTRTFFNVTTSDDPVVRSLANDSAGSACVFASDMLLAQLMVSSRSLATWDLVVHRVGSSLFLDKRDSVTNDSLNSGGNSFATVSVNTLDLLTVNETATEQLPEDKEGINSSLSLSREATFINQCFSQQVLSKEESPRILPNPHPFQAEGERASGTAYRYRRWSLGNITTPNSNGDNSIGVPLKLVVRCEIDCVARGTEPQRDSLLTVRALHEFDPKTGVDWRKKIDTQRGAVFANELKNNSFKMAKWAVQALLAGTDAFKLGYVTRQTPKDNLSHVILAVQEFIPKEFATQVNVNSRNAWAVLKHIVSLCMKQPNGKYILLRDNEKPCLRLFAVPSVTSNETEVSVGERNLSEEKEKL